METRESTYIKFERPKVSIYLFITHYISEHPCPQQPYFNYFFNESEVKIDGNQTNIKLKTTDYNIHDPFV